MSWPTVDHSILSPSGRISKAARKRALARETARLFAEWGGHMPGPRGPKQPSEKEKVLNQARRLRELAGRGMSRRKYAKEADRLEALAVRLS